MESWAERHRWWLLVGIIAFGGAICLRLALVQNTFIDEVTQLSGITLSVPDLFSWLLQSLDNPFEAAPDRQPPLSYLVMQVLAAFGAGETGLRLWGVLFAMGATAVVYKAGEEGFGVVPGLIVAALFVSATNMPGTAVVIRPYPLLLLFAAACVLFTLRSFRQEGTRSLWWAAGFAVLAVYTHFFGLVLLGAVSVAAVALAVWEKRAWKPVALPLATGWLLSMGVVPFVLSVMGGGDEEARGSLAAAVVATAAGLAELIFGTVFGKLIVFNWLAFGLSLLGFAALGAATLWVLVGQVRALRFGAAMTAEQRTLLGLTVMAVAGLGAVALAGVVTHGMKFSATATHYNNWLRPVVMLILAAGLIGPWKRVALTGAGAMLAGRLLIGLPMLINPAGLVNSPVSVVEDVLEGDRGTLVLFPARDLGWTYYPFREELDPAQELLILNSYEGEGTRQTYSHQAGYGPQGQLEDRDRLVFVETERLNSLQVAKARRRGGINCADEAQKVEAWAARNGHIVTERAQHIGFLSACVFVTETDEMRQSDG